MGSIFLWEGALNTSAPELIWFTESGQRRGPPARSRGGARGRKAGWVYLDKRLGCLFTPTKILRSWGKQSPGEGDSSAFGTVCCHWAAGRQWAVESKGILQKLFFSGLFLPGVFIIMRDQCTGDRDFEASFQLHCFQEIFSARCHMLFSCRETVMLKSRTH